ncbi:guanine nucleotide-releasing factor 2 isoform X3 [Condylostylus longicornis]|uniref:guanine nucleotide-releasing factor 2 isoform X3 n=1 Tax=Condylostylus longicornis TaxID=2530218 RepID=UPI00244DF679|nr:guanine nucleotide-releasing factor 2 isoform X3 [Condylostylus longicornis]
MTSTHKSDNVSSPSTPGSSGITSAHKNSLKSSKLARRARSFKEMKDGLFEKISQIRTPTNTLGRSHSPSHKRNRENKTTEESKPTDALDRHVRDIKNALKHFKDVILKKKYEVLPGNGTIIIELANNMCLALQSQIESQTLQSALNQVYLSLAKLLKLCDEILVCEDENDCASLNDENVKEIVTLFENAVQNLFNVAIEKIQDKENTNSTSNTLCRPSIDIAGQRTSLPDIPLTPNERDILQKSCSNPMRTSHSTESILRDSSPPPKPPLPVSRKTNPPPLPPKRRINQRMQNIPVENDNNTDSAIHLGIGIDQLSLRSKSPDDNSSLLSASAGSLDSALNHSREEDELKAIVMETSFEDQHSLDNDFNLAAFTRNSNIVNKNVEKNISFLENNEIKDNRRSNESGFMSVQSLRTSTQSGGSSTKRSSGQSNQSQKSNSLTPNSIDPLSISATANNNDTIKFETYHQKEEHQKHAAIFNSNSCDQNVSHKHLLQRQELTTCNNTLTSSTKQSLTSTMKSQQTISSSSSSTTFSTLNFSQEEILSNNLNDIDTLIDFQTQKCNLPGKTTNICLNTLTRNGKPQGNENVEKKINPTKNTSTVMSNTQTCLGNDINKLGEMDEVDNLRSISPLSPPALPAKTRNKRDNTFFQFEKRDDDLGLAQTDFIGLRSTSTSNFIETRHQSLIDHRWGDIPPPLPAKKKHIIAYMEICSASSRSSTDALRHSVHTYNISSNSSDSFSPNRSIIHSQTMNLQNVRHQLSQNSVSSFDNDEKPPALPPKRQPKSNNCRTPTIITTPPESPKPGFFNDNIASGNVINSCTIGNDIARNKKATNQIVEMSTVTEETSENLIDDQKQKNNQNQTNLGLTECNDDDDDEVVLRNNENLTPEKLVPSPKIKVDPGVNLMEEIDVSDYLIFKKEGEDGPDVKGGYLDALIVYATKLHKNNENDEECDEFGEAFITTFRTFIRPVELIRKLINRYNVFICEAQKKKVARETYSLLYRVVNDLTASDIDPHLYSILMEFVYCLVSTGELPDAKVIRNKIVDKIKLYKELKYGSSLYEPQRNIVTNQPTLLDLKSNEIAEQMTLLDAELFQKIEIPEVLLFAKDQCDEKTPNLNKFTEHFNKMSYWARSQILKQDDAKDREKYVIKFIKIMKHLRKINNYNSYLALLSALDSGPIRRLEWHKTITEGLKEYCALIDSSSSFRIYRQALGDTTPPCIPYIGLVLQDLTFVHVGNPDYLKNGVINFSKRWQQYFIIVNMKRFKSCSYLYKRNEKIIQFFENFENFLGEEQMWQISENIKPRGRRPNNN